MKIWRVAAIALMAGLALFLITLLVKLVVVALATFLVIRVVGGRLAGRFMAERGRMGGFSTDIISIDNPAYRMPGNRVRFERIIPVS